MSKVLTANEILKAINILNDDIDCQDHYEHFIEDLSKLLAKHAGGEFSQVTDQEFGEGMFITFNVNELVPADGGVYKNFDTDVTWKDGVET
jgi:hypothetical protein